MNSPILCGGTFLSLILQAIKPRNNVRENVYTSTDGLSNEEVFKGLIKVMKDNATFPSAGNSFRTTTSKYRSCKIHSNTYIPFTNLVDIQEFDDEIKNSYSNVLTRMNSFINKYLDLSNIHRIERLVSALNELISDDKSIKKGATFLYGPNNYIDKYYFINLRDIYLDQYLLAIFHYIIIEKIDNTTGDVTFESWHRKTNKNSPWKFISYIGRQNQSDFTVKIYSDDDKTDDPIIDEGTYTNGNQSFYSGQSNDYKNGKQHLNQTIVIQNGEQNIQATHIENLNL